MTFRYRVPVQAGSPWPTFRRDHRNTGCSPIAARYHGDEPWSFQTGKGIFATPVIDRDGTVYIGSADHKFYALNADGTERWHFQSDEIIDSAAALPAVDLDSGSATVLVPSGDGHLYCLRTGDGSVLWSFDARVAPTQSYNDWWEANVAIGPDGTIYAGNTNFQYYAIHADGSLKWTYLTGANAWSQAAFADDGTIFWGSCDTKVHAVGAGGRRRWTRRTLGFISASAALGSDGTVYIGSFDSSFRALNPHTGRVKWKFRTGDHIYGSAALEADDLGNTSAIYFASTDGVCYALSPDGTPLWSYDTGAPVRSSPALGPAPSGEEGQILYFGSGNGRIYALNAVDGSLRWSLDTTSEKPELRDRNDLNGSPALGRTGIYIGGEHGQLWYVPYDYPLSGADRARSSVPGLELPSDTVDLCYVTPGGNLHTDGTPTISPSSIITLRLMVRHSGQTVDAHVYNAPIGRPRDALAISVQPEFPFHVEHSADGRYIHIIPEGFLEPGTDYTVRAAGDWYSGGLRIGNLSLGGRKRGRFDRTVKLHSRVAGSSSLPLQVGESKVAAFEWTRLAVPIPPMLPSLNQIGFDYIDWIVGTVAIGEPDEDGQGRLLMWAIGARRDEQGMLVADPDSDFTLPLSGSYRGSDFILSNRHFSLAVTGIPIPFNLFQLRGQFAPDLRVLPGAAAYADTRVLSIPTFGPLLVLAGLANNWWQRLLAIGTFVTRPYPEGGPANARPQGVSITDVRFVEPSGLREGKVVASVDTDPGAAYGLDRHRAGIMLVDEVTLEPVYLDYHSNLQSSVGPSGNLRSITLIIPAGTRLPPSLQAIVLLDVFPIARVSLVTA